MRTEDKANKFRKYQSVSGIPSAVAPEFLKLIKNGWRAVYAAIFDNEESPFVSRLAPHQAEAIEWHWKARLALINKQKPDYWAYFPIWSRGHMKSTIAKHIAVVDALISVAFHEPAYILYISRNKDMASKHASSIETDLTKDSVKNFCPGISQVKRNEQGSSKGWKATFLNTSVGAVFHFGGLDEGLAGGNIDDVRPTLIVPDDIDGRESTPTEGENRFNKLTSEVLPMRQYNTLTFYAQNLINRYSVMYRIQSGQARVLTNRKPTQPIPAVINPKFETKTVDGIVKDIIIGGAPTWNYYNLERCQEEIETIGLPAFLRECQHEVELSKEGLIALNYDDAVHVISESEFASVFGSPVAWRNWNNFAANDWARTKTERHANVAAWISVSNQNTALPGFTFITRPFSFPAQSEPEDVAERFLSALTPYAYNRVTWADVRRDALLRANVDRHAQTFSEKLKYERDHLARIIPKYSKPLLRRCNVRGGVMGHSDDTVRSIYNFGYGFNFIPINPGKHGGIETLNRAMVVDYQTPHAFRLEQMGYTRWYILAPDDKTATPRIVNGKEVFPPKPFPTALRPDELHNSDLIRYQLSNWRYREAALTATGEVIDDPLKINDDFGQMLQMFYESNIISNIRLTEAEMLYQAVSDKLKPLIKKKNLTMGEQLALDEEIREKQREIKKFRNPLRSDISDFEGCVTPSLSISQKENLDENGFQDIYL